MLKYKSKKPSSAYAIIPPRKAPCEPVLAQREHRISMTIKSPSTTRITVVPPCPIPCATASTTCVMPSPKMKRILASKICRSEFTPERRPIVRNHPAPRRTRSIITPLGSIAPGAWDVLAGVPPGLSDMFAPGTAGRIPKHRMLYCYAKPIAQSSMNLRHEFAPALVGLRIHPRLPVVIVCDQWLLLPTGVVWRKVFCGTFIWGQGRQLSQGAGEGIPCFFERHWYGELRSFFRSAS